MPVGSVQVRLRGPVLNGQAPPIINDTLRLTVGDVAAEGERIVKGELVPGHGLVTGHYRRSIHGETTGVRAGIALAAAGVGAGQFFASPHGIIHDSQVIYGPWLEGVSSRNQSTRFKGYSMFRKARQQLETTKGVFLQRRVQQALQRLR